MAKMLWYSNTEQYNEIPQGLGGFQGDSVSPDEDCAVARLLVVLHQYGAPSPRPVLGSNESLQLEGQFGRNDLRIDMPEPEWKNSIAVLRLGTLMKSSNRVKFGQKQACQLGEGTWMDNPILEKWSYSSFLKWFLDGHVG